MSTRMRHGLLTGLMLAAVGVAFSGAVAWAQDNGCEGGVPNVGYGDGSSGDFTVSSWTTYYLPPNRNYRNFTVSANATLDTRGNTLRVCGTLTNHGTITDTYSGGDGGVGGRAGDGSDPNLSLEQAYCGKDSMLCSDGGNGGLGTLGSHPSAGRGGRGGAGGGGGGGAYCAATEDVNGGNGGRGGAGGAGGGRVLIYAYRLANHGVVQADGQDGDDGANAPNTYGECGAKYHKYYFLGWHDLASGGGGGGSGGCGGEGGRVEIHYARLDNLGEVHADGGEGGARGTGGLSGTDQVGHVLEHGCAGVEGTGCPGGNGYVTVGHGGRGARQVGDEAEKGEDGIAGEAAAAGDVILDPTGATLYVWPDGSGYYPTIQAAINAAQNGDVVRLMDGIFQGAENRDIDYLGKNITLRSNSGDPTRSTIDCEGHTGFYIDGSTSDAQLYALTIENAEVVDSQGGAVQCISSSVRITDCIFRRCSAAGSQGGAVFVNAGHPTIEGCTFDACFADQGAGIFYMQAGNTDTPCSLSRCTFHGNDGLGSSLALQDSEVEVDNSILAFGLGGDPVHCAMSTATLSCCDVYGNSGGDWVGCIAGQLGLRWNFSADPDFCLQMTEPRSFQLYDVSPCAPQAQPSCGLVGAWPVGCEVPITSLLPGHEFQDGFGQGFPEYLDPYDTGNANIGYDLSGEQEEVNDWLGDSAVVSGPEVTGPENGWLVKLCFKITRKGPVQDDIAAYQDWKNRLPCDPESEYVCVVLDSLEVAGVPRNDRFTTYFREGEPGFLEGPDLSEAQEILPDRVFVPGTKVEYYYSSFLSQGEFQASTSYVLGPYEFEILPSMRWSTGAQVGEQRDIVWPSVLYVDASDDVLVPEWPSSTVERMGPTQDFINGAFDRLDIPCDRYDYLGASADWSASLARSFGGTVFNPGSHGNNGCAIMQLLGYRLLLVNTGTAYQNTMRAADFNLFDVWLATSICGIRDYRRGLILNGDAIAVIMGSLATAAGEGAGDSREIGALQFLQSVLGVHVRTYNLHVPIGPQFCIFLEADEGGGDDPPAFVPDAGRLAAYGDSSASGNCHFAFAVLDTVGGVSDLVGNLSYLNYTGGYRNYAQIVRSQTVDANWRSVVDGFSLPHLVEQMASLDDCECDSASTCVAIDQLLRPELEWIMGGAPDSALALWAYPCTPTSAVKPDAVPDVAPGGLMLECPPNPFTPGAVLRIRVPATRRLEVGIFDVAGRLVCRFVRQRVPAGVQEIAWDGRGSSGQVVGSGVYWVRAEVKGQRSPVRRLLLLR